VHLNISKALAILLQATRGRQAALVQVELMEVNSVLLTIQQQVQVPALSIKPSADKVQAIVLPNLIVVLAAILQLTIVIAFICFNQIL
jgi:hypothetical protein